MTYTTQADRVVAQLGPVPIVELTPAQVAWLAALIDGEGCVGIWRQRDPKRKGGFKYRPVVQVINTNLDLIARVKQLVDGYVTVDGHARNKNPKHRVCYRIMVSRRAIPALLECVMDWLIVKRKQADVVTRFCRASLEVPLHATYHELHEHFYQECKLLNKRGIK